MDLYSLNNALLLTNLDRMYPTELVIPAGQTVNIKAGDTGFLIVTTGVAEIVTNDHSHRLKAHMFASVVGPAIVKDMTGLCAVRRAYRGLMLFGGPVEDTGRLRYIDGCLDTLLVSPPVKGDPCLNLLHIPQGVSQTAHTHPSVRLGCVLAGEGHCVTTDGKMPLTPGEIFVLPAEEVHSFHTTNKDVLIVVYHPDSDFGPTNEAHPMLNKTFVDGKSARRDF
jgi:quercetin dioxygenase-like cupin family protein